MHAPGSAGSTKRKRTAAGALLAGLLALGLGSCHSPRSAAPAPAPSQAMAPVAAQPPAPQFTFASWRQVQPLIKSGRVIETVTGKDGLSLILDNHSWVHVVAKPGEPLPRNPLDYVYRFAPNASAIKHIRQ